jgi:flagellar biosynthesis protein FliR
LPLGSSMDFLIPFTTLQAFLMVFFRCLGLIAAMPVLGGKETPKRFKVGMGLFITIVLFPNLEPSVWPPAASSLIGWVGLIFVETFIGIFMGLVATMLVWTAQFAGQMIGFQMGFGIVSVIDPQSGQQLSLIARILQLTAMLLFIFLNGHHMLIESLLDSYTWLAGNATLMQSDIMEAGIALSGRLVSDGLRLGAPVLGALLLTEVGLGLVARTVPQMNIFIVGFPLKIGMGMLMLALALPAMAMLFSELLQEGVQSIADLLV